MHFVMEFKRGPNTVAKVQGHTLDKRMIEEFGTVAVIELEQKLERMLGTRVHINIQEFNKE